MDIFFSLSQFCFVNVISAKQLHTRVADPKFLANSAQEKQVEKTDRKIAQNFSVSGLTPPGTQPQAFHIWASSAQFTHWPYLAKITFICWGGFIMIGQSGGLEPTRDSNPVGPEEHLRSTSAPLCGTHPGTPHHQHHNI